MFGIAFAATRTCVHIYLPGEFEGTRCARTSRCWPAMVKPWPGIVDVEPMPDEGDERSRRGGAKATDGEEVTSMTASPSASSSPTSPRRRPTPG